MAEPSGKGQNGSYHSIRNSEIEEIALKNGKLRLLAGEFEGKRGYISQAREE